MIDFISQYTSQIATLIAGLVGGATIGSIITLKIARKNRASGHGTIVDQSSSRSSGDITGRDKVTGRK